MPLYVPYVALSFQSCGIKYRMAVGEFCSFVSDCGTFRRVESCMVWIAVATAALLSWILQLTLNANQQQQPLDSKAAIMATGLYLLFVGVWCVVYFYPKGRLP